MRGAATNAPIAGREPVVEPAFKWRAIAGLLGRDGGDTRTNPHEPVEVDGEPPVPRSRTSDRAASLPADSSMLLLYCVGVLVGSAGAIGLYYAAGRNPVLSWAVAFGLVIAGAVLATGAFQLARW